MPALTLLFNRVAGQVEVPTGQVNFRGSLPNLHSILTYLILGSQLSSLILPYLGYG